MPSKIRTTNGNTNGEQAGLIPRLESQIHRIFIKPDDKDCEHNIFANSRGALEFRPSHNPKLANFAPYAQKFKRFYPIFTTYRPR